MKCAFYLYQHDLRNSRDIWDDLRAWSDLNNCRVTAKYIDIEEQDHLGSNALIRAAEAGEFELVLIYDTAPLRETSSGSPSGRLRELVGHCIANGVVVYSITEGQVNSINLEDAAAGQNSRQILAQSGQHLAGNPYGYRAKTDQGGNKIAGQLEIDPDQSKIVKQIFSRYINGDSPYAIATWLNNCEIPSGRGGKWRHQLVKGPSETSRGILNRPIYVGRPAYFTTSRVDFPPTTKAGLRRSSFFNLRKHWIEAKQPELRIIDDKTWQKAQARISEKAKQTSSLNSHRPLYGKISCAVCHGPVKMLKGDRYMCENSQSGSCRNTKGIKVSNLERRVLEQYHSILTGLEHLENSDWERQQLRTQLKAVEQAIFQRQEDPKSTDGNEILFTRIEHVEVSPQKGKKSLAVTIQFLHPNAAAWIAQLDNK